MSLTPEQQLARRKAIGSSEAAAVLGQSPWASPQDIYWRKVAPVDPTPQTEAQARGHRLEPVVLQFFKDETGLDLNVQAQTVFHPNLPLCATPDGLVVGKPEGVNAKTSIHADEWGEEGTDEIPVAYIIQHQQECYVLNLERVWVPVMILGRYEPQWRIYKVERSEKFGRVADYLTDWWRRHVEAKQAPTNAPPPLEILKHLRREPKSSVLLGAQAVELLDQFEQAREAASEAEKAKKEAQAAVLSLLGVDEPAEEGVLPDGRVITYYEYQRKGYTVEPSSYRQMKIKTPKPQGAIE